MELMASASNTDEIACVLEGLWWRTQLATNNNTSGAMDAT